MAKLTPAQLARIAELKNKKKPAAAKPAPVVIPEPAPVVDDIETFLAEEFPDPVPAAPEPVEECLHDAGYDLNGVGMMICNTCRADITPEPETPAVTDTLLVANPDGTITPEPEPIDIPAAFRAWLRTPQGLNASDPRLPEDPVRRAIELEDALLVAFRAGFNLTNAAPV